MNAKMTSPNLEALTVQNEEEIHTQVSEYEALMPGTPQQGQLLSPRQTEKASRRVLTAEQEFTTRQKEGRNQAHSFRHLPLPPCTQKLPRTPGGQCTLCRGWAPASTEPVSLSSALEALCAEHRR